VADHFIVVMQSSPAIISPVRVRVLKKRIESNSMIQLDSNTTSLLYRLDLWSALRGSRWSYKFNDINYTIWNYNCCYFTSVTFLTHLFGDLNRICFFIPVTVSASASGLL